MYVYAEQTETLRQLIRENLVDIPIRATDDSFDPSIIRTEMMKNQTYDAEGRRGIIVVFDDVTQIFKTEATQRMQSLFTVYATKFYSSMVSVL